mmetsp:Transcript_66474/g.185279  ORF Transcript_66474/g.185279 Transcript_66474/m.185279 type:complete len:491 (+) Transcript_66474:522-1994(+)
MADGGASLRSGRLCFRAAMTATTGERHLALAVGRVLPRAPAPRCWSSLPDQTEASAASGFSREGILPVSPAPLSARGLLLAIASAAMGRGSGRYTGRRPSTPKCALTSKRCSGKSSALETSACSAAPRRLVCTQMRRQCCTTPKRAMAASSKSTPTSGLWYIACPEVANNVGASCPWWKTRSHHPVANRHPQRSLTMWSRWKKASHGVRLHVERRKNVLQRPPRSSCSTKRSGSWSASRRRKKRRKARKRAKRSTRTRTRKKTRKRARTRTRRKRKKRRRKRKRGEGATTALAPAPAPGPRRRSRRPRKNTRTTDPAPVQGKRKRTGTGIASAQGPEVRRRIGTVQVPATRRTGGAGTTGRRQDVRGTETAGARMTGQGPGGRIKSHVRGLRRTEARTKIGIATGTEGRGQGPSARTGPGIATGTAIGIATGTGTRTGTGSETAAAARRRAGRRRRCRRPRRNAGAAASTLARLCQSPLRRRSKVGWVAR